jgi:hypothetical protein
MHDLMYSNHQWDGKCGGSCLSTLLYVYDITIYYSSWRTCTFKRSLQITLVFHTGFCRLDSLYLLQTPMAYTIHSSAVYILLETVPS